MKTGRKPHVLRSRTPDRSFGDLGQSQHEAFVEGGRIGSLRLLAALNHYHRPGAGEMKLPPSPHVPRVFHAPFTPRIGSPAALCTETGAPE